MISDNLYEEAETYYINGEYSKALKLFKKCYELDEDIDSLNYIGCCYLNLNEFNSSINVFNDLINTCPDWDRPLFNLGRVYLKQERFAEALEYFNKALSINPNGEAIYFYFGVYNDKIGNLEKAIENYKKSLSINNCQPEAHLNLGVCYSKLGMHELAIVEFDCAYNQDNELLDSLYNKGLVFLVMKNYHKALETFLSFDKLQPDDIENMVDIASCYFRINDLDKSLEWVEKILYQDVNNIKGNKLLKTISAKKSVN